jgi:hypothetical protein
MSGKPIPTCATCRWWGAPLPPPPGWGGHVNEYGTCRHFANDYFTNLAGIIAKVRCANETRAEYTCPEHTPQTEARS